LSDAPSGESSIGTRWLIPVLVRTVADARAEGTGSDGVARVLLTEERAPLPPGPGDGPVLLNAGGWGVYRVGYPPEHRARLAERLQALTSLERFDLLSDTWALVLAGRAELGELFELAARLGDEEEEAVETYHVVVSSLHLCARVADAVDRPAVVAAAQTLLRPRADALGWDARAGEGERVPTLRALLLEALGTTGETKEVLTETARRFGAWRQGGVAIDANLESAVLAVVADQNREGDYEAVLDRYRHPANPQEERRHLLALGCFADLDLCGRTFELAIGEVRSQDGPVVVRSLLANRVGGSMIWERVKAEWSRILDRFPDVSHAAMVSAVRTLCHDPALADDVTQFLADHPLPVGQRTVAQTLERLAVNVRFGERLRGKVAGELAKTVAR
ncbi:MAG: ERAP1-like C-terminal domain-containing protein, partial [Acidimicrobiales bacterium]